MKSNWHRTMLSLGLGAALAGGALTTGGCVVRAHGGVRGEVYEADEAPPPPREEHVEVRAGYVWVRGHWARRAHRWDWVNGHWQADRSGYAWQAGHWQRQGHQYAWVPGRWVAVGSATVEVRDHRTPAPEPEVRDHRTHPAPVNHVPNNGRRQITAYPTNPPPPPRVEHPQRRHGYVWIPGAYHWGNGSYVWQAGHWEAERAGYRWQAGHWERSGNRYVWIAGSWARR